ncbi:MAG: hypothetical protein GY809_03435 [Planctomycetes bacterium]|nr:hypothetical protein [Planctomycetota bacterium]
MAHDIRQGKRGFKKRHLFGVVFLVGLLVFGAFRFQGNRKLGRRIETLRAQGYPMSMAELGDQYRDSAPTEQDNAWPVYLAAFESLVQWEQEACEDLPGYNRKLLYERGESWTSLHMEQARDFLADNKESLELLYSAPDIGPCFRPVDFASGYDMQILWLSEARECARLLRLASQVAVQQGDVEGALKSIEAIFPLAESANAPVTVMNLVRIAIWAPGIAEIEDVVNHHALTDEQMQALTARIEPIEVTDSTRQSLIGERCSAMGVFNAPPRDMSMFFSDNELAGLWPLLAVPRKILGLHDQDALSCINMTQTYIEAVSLQRHEALTRIKAIDNEHRSKLGMVAKMLTPNFRRIYELELRSVTRSLCARTALAVERYRLGAGRLPDTLDQLVPTLMARVPVDPFDGQPLRFLHRDKGFVVYSVGEDLKDNQGEERIPSKNRKEQSEWDQTFTVIR